MKRVLLSVVLLITLLAGCSSPIGVSAPTAPVIEFESEISSNCDDLTFGGVWDSTETGIFELVLNYPQTVNGTTYLCNCETVTITLGSLNQTVALADLPQNGLPRVLFEIFRVCSAGTGLHEPIQDGEWWNFSGSCFGNTFVLQTDSAGAIRTIVIEQQNIKISFLTEE